MPSLAWKPKGKEILSLCSIFISLSIVIVNVGLTSSNYLSIVISLFFSFPASNSQLFLWKSINVLTEVNTGNKCKTLKTSIAIKTWSIWNVNLPCKSVTSIYQLILFIFFYCFELSQISHSFSNNEWSEKDVMLHIKSPKMDGQQRRLSIQFKAVLNHFCLLIASFFQVSVFY